MKSLICLGFGYCAQEVARQLGAADITITGTSRDIRAPHLHYVTGSPGDNLKSAIRQASHILISISPNPEGCPVFDDLAQDIRHAPALRWLGYISSTGVYGDYAGAWVDERSACRPQEPRSVARLKAEQQWMSLFHDHATPVHIFRLAGIYGPKRNIFTTLRDNKAQRIDAKDHVFSRCHVEDIAQALIASMRAPSASNIYNIADNAPASSADVVAYGAQLLGIKAPPLVPLSEASISAMTRSFYQAHRRVSSEKIQEELQIEWRYPSYKEGLASLIQDGCA